ncbi:hypothetical protein M378DRAFT_22754 [Amanita muscaria Koide BX008]|uniref:Uncharacterized protein n=1 Tax=Amanita muscaria (strain Koide BX008) TaxID=946122 RepID=A0A0C2TKQ3_AMAMK|nr:hypothetical protein M378DRAFT_22754 [Amanita muscaria Koide BX008]
MRFPTVDELWQGYTKIVSKTSNQQATSPSIPALLEKAQSLLVQCDYDLALRFARRILEIQPSHAEATEIAGISLLETGDTDGAKEAFTSLVSSHPGSSNPPPPSAHLYLAQLSDDEPKLALQHYKAAVDILVQQLKGKDRETAENAQNDDAEIRNSIVRVLIGQVEIWMDPSYDLCFEPEAESTCEELLKFALQIDPGNPEALQAMASVRLSQQRLDDAKRCLEQAWSTWKDLDLGMCCDLQSSNYQKQMGKFILINYSDELSLREFHNRAVALVNNHRYLPFPALFLVHEMRVRGFHPFAPVNPNIPDVITWREWIVSEGVFTEASGLFRRETPPAPSNRNIIRSLNVRSFSAFRF